MAPKAGRRKTPHDGKVTRRKLMDAAEQLFAEDGVEGVSIRAVNAAAGLAPAAVHYHFGSRDALLDAVLSRRGDPILAEIARRSDELLSQAQTPAPRDLLEALVLPHAEMLRDDRIAGTWWMKIAIQQEVFNGVGHSEHSIRANAALQDLLHRVFPDVAEHILQPAWKVTAYSVMLLLAWAFDDEPEPGLDVDLGTLLRFAEGGLLAAVRTS